MSFYLFLIGLFHRCSIFLLSFLCCLFPIRSPPFFSLNLFLDRCLLFETLQGGRQLYCFWYYNCWQGPGPGPRKKIEKKSKFWKIEIFRRKKIEILRRKSKKSIYDRKIEKKYIDFSTRNRKQISVFGPRIEKKSIFRPRIKKSVFRLRIKNIDFFGPESKNKSIFRPRIEKNRFFGRINVIKT